MKIVIWSLVLVGIYFVYHFAIGTTLTKYSSCYEEANTKIATADVTVANMCAFTKLTYDEMSTCIENVKQANNFAGFIYEGSPTKKLIEKDFDAHNEICRSNKIEAPVESFYMSQSAGTKR